MKDPESLQSRSFKQQQQHDENDQSSHSPERRSLLAGSEVDDDSTKKTLEPMSARDATNRDHVKGWDGQRGFFTIIVVLAHMNCPLARNAWIIVGFFFTLSGLLITSLTLKVYEKKGEIGIMLFYQRRISRLIPSALLVIFACCLYVVVMKLFSPSTLSGIDIYWMRRDMLWATFYSSNWEFMIKGEDYFAKYDDLSLLRHYWSLAIEEQYYICWPILLLMWTSVIPPVINYFIGLFRGKAALKASNGGGALTAASNHSTEGGGDRGSDSATVAGAGGGAIEAAGGKNGGSEEEKRVRFKYLLISLLIGDMIVVIGSWGYQLSLLANNAPYYVLHYSTAVHLKEFALGGAAAALVKLTPALDGLMFSTSEYVPKFSFQARMFFELLILLGHVYLLTIALAPIWDNLDQLMQWQFSYGSMTIALTIAVTNILQVIQSKEMIHSQRKYFPVSELFLSSDLLATLGKISYQTYLWHVPIIVWTAAAYHDVPSIGYFFYAAFIFACIYSASIAMSAYFEFPALKALMAVKEPRKVIAGMFICMLLLAALIAAVTNNYEDPYAYEHVEKENMNTFADMDSSPITIASLHSGTAPADGSGTFSVAVPAAAAMDPIEYVLHSDAHFEECRRIESSTKFIKFKYVTLISELFASVRTEGEFKDYLRNLYNVRYHAMVSDRLELKEYLPGLKRLVSNSTMPDEDKQDVKFLVVKGQVKSGHKYRPVCSELMEFKSMVKSNDNFYVLYVHDSRFPSTDCPGLPTHGVIDIEGDHFVSIDMRRVLAEHPPSEAIAQLEKSDLDEFWLNVNDESFKLHITDIRYMVSAMVETAVTMMPELLPFFKCGFFADHKNKYFDSRDLNAVNSQATVLVKRRVAYLGNSVASRYAYLVETARSQLLGKCAAAFAALDASDPRNALSIALFETMMNFAVGNVAKHGNDIIKNTMGSGEKEQKELHRVTKYLRDNQVTTVVIEDSDFLHQIIIETDGAFAKLGDSNEAVAAPAHTSHFDRFLRFLVMLHEDLGVSKVYFHDMHVWNGISKSQLGPYADEVGAPRMGYQMVLSMMEALFRRCETYLQKQWDGEVDASGACFTSDPALVSAAKADATAADASAATAFLLRKLATVRSLLTFVDESHLSCPQPRMLPSGLLSCPKAAWGYDPILSDGMHPAGSAGDFVGTNVLHQLTQDLYIEQFLGSAAGQGVSAMAVKSFPSTFATYSASRLPGKSQADYETFFAAMNSFARTSDKCQLHTGGSSKLEPPFEI